MHSGEDMPTQENPTQEISGGVAPDVQEIPPDVWGQAYFNGNLKDKHCSVDFVKDEIVFGRKNTCDVRLFHPGTSSIHCKLMRMGGVGSSILMLKDMSRNGTYVNGTRIGMSLLYTIRYILHY